MLELDKCEEQAKGKITLFFFIPTHGDTRWAYKG
jgi:hypothetical protein